jgi:hypothetical protein
MKRQKLATVPAFLKQRDDLPDTSYCVPVCLNGLNIFQNSITLPNQKPRAPVTTDFDGAVLYKSTVYKDLRIATPSGKLIRVYEPDFNDRDRLAKLDATFHYLAKTLTKTQNKGNGLELQVFGNNHMYLVNGSCRDRIQ